MLRNRPNNYTAKVSLGVELSYLQILMDINAEPTLLISILRRIVNKVSNIYFGKTKELISKEQFAKINDIFNVIKNRLVIQNEVIQLELLRGKYKAKRGHRREAIKIYIAMEKEFKYFEPAYKKHAALLRAEKKFRQAEEILTQYDNLILAAKIIAPPVNKFSTHNYFHHTIGKKMQSSRIKFEKQNLECEQAKIVTNSGNPTYAAVTSNTLTGNIQQPIKQMDRNSISFFSNNHPLMEKLLGRAKYHSSIINEGSTSTPPAAGVNCLQ